MLDLKTGYAREREKPNSFVDPASMPAGPPNSAEMLLTVLEAAAITVVFTQGTIFARVRNWGRKESTHGDPYRTATGEPGLLALWRELLNCPLCLGWWLGSGSYGLQIALGRADLGWDAPLHVVGAGALSGALALLYKLATSWLDNASALADAEERAMRK